MKIVFSTIISTILYLNAFSQDTQRFVFVGEKTQAEIQISDKEVECVRLAAMDLVRGVKTL